MGIYRSKYKGEEIEHLLDQVPVLKTRVDTLEQHGGGMTEAQKAQLEELTSRFELDEPNMRLLVFGDPKEEETEPTADATEGEETPTDEPSEETEGGAEEETPSEETPVTVNRRKYFVGLTELFAPDHPTIAETTYYVVTGSASITIVNHTTGATMYWRNSGNGGSTWTNWASTTGTVSLASGFSNNADNTDKLYKVQVKAVLNGEESEVKEYDITIKPEVAPGSVTVTRTPNDNKWATAGTVTITLSPTKGAVSQYSIDGGTTWKDDFTEAEIAAGKKEIPITATIAANVYGVKATKTDYGYKDSEEKYNTAATLKAKKAYYGFSTASTLSGSADILELASTGGEVEADKLSKALVINPTGSTGGYIWLCCTGTLSKDSIVSKEGDVIPFGFNDAIPLDGWNCYRSSNKVNPETTNVYIP